MAKPNENQMAKKGDLVVIHNIILKPGERSDNLPEATRNVPYECWIKGFLLDEVGQIGRQARIESFIGRVLTGILTEINPVYDHNFGEPQPELNYVGIDAWKKLEDRG